MKDYEKMWNELKNDMKLAVKTGFEKGFNSTPETSDGGRIAAFQYVLDFMDDLDDKYNKLDKEDTK